MVNIMLFFIVVGEYQDILIFIMVIFYGIMILFMSNVNNFNFLCLESYIVQII